MTVYVLLEGAGDDSEPVGVLADSALADHWAELGSYRSVTKLELDEPDLLVFLRDSFSYVHSS